MHCALSSSSTCSDTDLERSSCCGPQESCYKSAPFFTLGKKHGLKCYITKTKEKAGGETFSSAVHLQSAGWTVSPSDSLRGSCHWLNVDMMYLYFDTNAEEAEHEGLLTECRPHNHVWCYHTNLLQVQVRSEHHLNIRISQNDWQWKRNDFSYLNTLCLLLLLHVFHIPGSQIHSGRV